MPKHDHKKINQAFVALTEETPAGQLRARDWLLIEENVERLLAAISGGQSVRRFCEAEGIAYSPVQRALTGDELEPRYRAAQEQMAEHLFGEQERICQLIEAGKMDGKDGGVILKNLEWRITKLNQRRYSDRIVQEQHTFDHTKMQMEAVRLLAGKPRRPAIEGEVIRPSLAAPDSAALRAFEQTKAKYPNALAALADDQPVDNVTLVTLGT